MKNLTGIITGALIVLALGFLIIQNCECCETKCAAEGTEEVTTEETVVDADLTEVIADDSTDVGADTSEVEIEATKE